MSKYLKGVLALTLSTALLFGCSKSSETNGIPNPTEVPAIGENSEVVNTNLLQVTNYFAEQNQVDANLLVEAEKGYTLDEPLVIVNPYGNSPLTAVAIFSTDTEVSGTITVKGKASEDNMEGDFIAAKNHIVPIYGLYSGDTTEVEIKLEDGTTKTLQITTDKVDLKTDNYQVEMLDEAAYDYSKMTFICGLNGYVYAVDSKGDLRWSFNQAGNLGVKVSSKGHLIIPTSYTLKPRYFKSGVLELDLLGKVYNEYAIPGGMHHDTFELSNGNMIIVGDRPNFETVEDYIVEIDMNTGEVVWELDLTDLIDPSEGGSLNRTEEDWFHNNGVWYDEPTDTILLSGRHVDAIVGINRTEKSLRWIIGNPEGWSEEYHKYFFTPQGDEFDWQYAQHQVTVLSNGHIMCFDNGAGRTKTTKPEEEVVGEDVFSRAVIYDIDVENMTIEQVWQYGKELKGEFYSEWVSGAISLENDPDNIWITSGSNLYNPEKNDYDYGPNDMFVPGLKQSTTIVQVKNNEPVYKLKLDHLTYRSLREEVYGEVGKFDVNAKGNYLGGLGVIKPAEVEVDVTNAETAKDVKLSLDPTKLTFTANYSIESEDDLKASYFVIRKGDGTLQAYNTEQTTVKGDNDVTVKTNGWISADGLSGTYDVYVVLGGTVYNTGYKVEF